MRHFIIETRLDTGRKRFLGASVREKYVAERDLAKHVEKPGRTLAIESFPTVAAAEVAIAAHNEPPSLSAAPAKALTLTQVQAAACNAAIIAMGVVPNCDVDLSFEPYRVGTVEGEVVVRKRLKTVEHYMTYDAFREAYSLTA